MKKILLSVLTICLALCVSCKKENSNGGSVNPTTTKTLSKVYLTYNNQRYISYNNVNWELTDEEEYDHVLNTEYIYDGDKLSEAINYYNNGNISSRDTITYSENGLITNITEYKSSSVDNWEMIYDNELLTKADLYRDGVMAGSYEYFYTDNKLTKAIYTSLNPNYVYNYELTWAGDNITQTKGIMGNWEYITTYYYDDKINPYTGNSAFETLSIVYTEFSALSKNNVISRSTNLEENDTYSYQYDGDYPSEKEYCYEDVFEFDNVWYKTITNYHYYLTYK